MAIDVAEVWEKIERLQGETFLTAKGLPYTYSVKGKEMFITRREKTITWSTVELALQNIESLRQEKLPVSGPKKLGVFGASYLYPVLIRIGVVGADEQKLRKGIIPYGLLALLLLLTGCGSRGVTLSDAYGRISTVDSFCRSGNLIITDSGYEWRKQQDADEYFEAASPDRSFEESTNGSSGDARGMGPEAAEGTEDEMRSIPYSNVRPYLSSEDQRLIGDCFEEPEDLTVNVYHEPYGGKYQSSDYQLWYEDGNRYITFDICDMNRVREYSSPIIRKDIMEMNGTEWLYLGMKDGDAVVLSVQNGRLIEMEFRDSDEDEVYSFLKKDR